MARRSTSLTLFLVVLLLAGSDIVHAKGGGVGSGPPLRPKPGRTDEMLYDKAMRIQARMWWHLSPDGMLVEKHRRGATPEKLSHTAVQLGDTAIWTGCYAASQACRWHVTRDPDALRQVRHLAEGLTLLSDATGVKGRLCRAAGRLVPGDPVRSGVVRAPLEGYAIIPDVSRDQLAGVTLGWACILKFVDDEALRQRARDQIQAIAIRLYLDGMWLRDFRGQKTKFGELRTTVEGVPFLENGPLAAIGYAPAAVAGAVSSDERARKLLVRLNREGWRDAIDEQQTWLPSIWTASNANMTALALLSTALHGGDVARGQALRGLDELRAISTGWANGGVAACVVLADPNRARRGTLDELRVALHVLHETEVPPRDINTYHVRRIATLRERRGGTWAWKGRLDRVHEVRPGSPPHPTITYTRADWLFAYWLARAAGRLTPRSGPGAGPLPQTCPMDLPPWLVAEPAPADDPSGR